MKGEQEVSITIHLKSDFTIVDMVEKEWQEVVEEMQDDIRELFWNSVFEDMFHIDFIVVSHEDVGVEE